METLGSLTDKLSIVNLKLWFQLDLQRGHDADAEVFKKSVLKTNVLNQQRNDLIDEIDTLFKDVVSGDRELKVYGANKDYNDKRK